MTTYGEWLAIKKKVMKHDGYTEVHMHVPRVDLDKGHSKVIYEANRISLSCTRMGDELIFYLKIDDKEYRGWNSIGLPLLSSEFNIFHVLFLVKEPCSDRIKCFVDKIHMMNSLSE
jgi:hypothetical protein